MLARAPPEPLQAPSPYRQGPRAESDFPEHPLHDGDADAELPGDTLHLKALRAPLSNFLLDQGWNGLPNHLPWAPAR